MCYTIPLAAAAITSIIWKKNKSVNMWSLNLMLYGASIFGIVDHLWNGELFLISDNITRDLLLGVVITAGIFITWKFIVKLSNRVYNKI